MIPRDYVTAWRTTAPWVDDAQVEQDLVISRVLVEMFAHPLLGRSLAFRGGTALYKLYLTPAARYSEDIDLVQVEAGRAGPVMDAIQATLNPWLGKPRWKQTQGRVTFRYGFVSSGSPSMRLRLKIEINTREHVAVLGHTKRSFSVRSRWFARTARIPTFELDELLATKLRALYQRKKGRDLFDLAVALEDSRSDPDRFVQTFRTYMEGAASIRWRGRYRNCRKRRCWLDVGRLRKTHDLRALGAQNIRALGTHNLRVTATLGKICPVRRGEGAMPPWCLRMKSWRTR